MQIQTATLCVCVNISAAVALGCLFVPKVYIVLFQPYKNVRTAGVRHCYATFHLRYVFPLQLTPTPAGTVGSGLN